MVLVTDKFDIWYSNYGICFVLKIMEVYVVLLFWLCEDFRILEIFDKLVEWTCVFKFI